jgi:hypothetical protein
MRLSQERTQELKKALKEHIKQHGKKEIIHAFLYLILSTL